MVCCAQSIRAGRPGRSGQRWQAGWRRLAVSGTPRRQDEAAALSNYEQPGVEEAVLLVVVCASVRICLCVRIHVYLIPLFLSVCFAEKTMNVLLNSSQCVLGRKHLLSLLRQSVALPIAMYC